MWVATPTHHHLDKNMNPINTYTNNHNKIAYILKKADELGFYSEKNANNATKLLHLLKSEVFSKFIGKKFEYIEMIMNFKDIITAHCTDKDKLYNIYKNTKVTFCLDGDEEHDVYEDSLVDKMGELAAERKLIFLNIAAHSYIVDRSEWGDYAMHGVCAILVPRRRSGYDMYYINPHGHLMKLYTYYTTVCSSTRVKQHAITGLLDCMVMKSLANYLNRTTDIDIHYDSTSRHNYYGANLQEGDNHGICFVIPIVIYYYLGIYYTEKKALHSGEKVKYVDCFRNLLKSGKIDRMVYCCFTNFNQPMADIVFNNLGKRCNPKDTISDCIERAQTHFTKKVTDTFMSFLSQIYFMRKL